MVQIIKEKERADRIARQIIGAEPIGGHEVDFMSIEKVVRRIKVEFCYMKSKAEGYYREPTMASISNFIYRWRKRGILESKDIRVPTLGVPAEKPSVTYCVNPSQVRALFLSHPKFDLKVNQPGWQSARKCTTKARKKPNLWKRIIKFFRKLFK